MRKTFLPFSPPSIGDEERAEVMDTLMTDWITTGPKTKAFEAKLKRQLEAPGVVALNSCTAGLHVGLVALGIKPGDEVIVPSMTFCATANVVEHVGATPVLVDVLPDTLNIDPAAAERAVTSRTKAIIPVHYGGHPVHLDAIFELADRHGLHVLEDAAHAISARYKGRLVGSRPNLAAFSFYATKNITTSEGGCLTGDTDLVERARIIGHHGMNRDAWKRFDRSGSWYYEVVLPGFKYNMTDIQAALGLHQLDRLAGFQKRRREVVKAYEAGLGRFGCIQLPVELPDVESSWHLYVIRLRLEQLRIDRNGFIEALKERNIGTSVHYLPVHMQPYYREKYGYRAEDCPVAADAFTRMITLPLHPSMTDQDIADVVESIEDIVRANEA
jgi:dTDP-4-amino-4,6-dideoxygalactose transaminase